MGERRIEIDERSFEGLATPKLLEETAYVLALFTGQKVRVTVKSLERRKPKVEGSDGR